jgi:secreted trypsin-like serine protease
MLALILLTLLAAALVRADDYEYEYQDDDYVAEDCDCGRPRRGGGQRIVGGREVDQHSLPHMAFITIVFPPFNETTTQYQDYRCGGTLINKRYVLTARHCAESRMPDGSFKDNFLRFDVKLGVHYTRNSGDHVQEFSVTRKDVIYYPADMNPRTMENDIMLLRLDRDVRFTKRIHPACLPKNSTERYDSGKAFVSGWGATRANQKVGDRLKETTLRLFPLDDEKCFNTVQKKVPDKQLCAYEDGTDSCQGDSGGPLMRTENGRYTVIGIVSHGSGCAREDHAGIYTRVTSFIDWINEVAEDGWCGSPESATTSNPTITETNNAPTTRRRSTDTKFVEGQLCDMSCKPKTQSLTTLDAIYNDGVTRFACYKGQCYAKDGSDFCAIIKNPYPCSKTMRGEIGELQCKYPCNLANSDLRWFIYRYLVGELPRLIHLKVRMRYYADCDLSTGYCCPYTPPGEKEMPGTDCAGNYIDYEPPPFKLI